MNEKPQDQIIEPHHHERIMHITLDICIIII